MYVASPLPYLVTGQRLHGYDAYEVLSALLAFGSGLALLVRRGRPAAGRRDRLNELLLCVAGLSLAVLLLHQVVTDGVCHGSCAFSLRGGR